MLKILQSGADTWNKKLEEVPRREDEDNVAWLKRNLSGKKAQTLLVLVGGKGADDFRLRVAQSHLRHNLTPSHWSHVFLLSDFAKGEVKEIALNPGKGFGFAAETNGVQIGWLERYRDPERFPNIALIIVPVKLETVQKKLELYQKQRAVLDSVELLVAWLSYVWGVGRTGNPLLDGNGIPSAAMIEVVLSSSGFELTPGLASRSSCPEAIWQSARWWHEYYDSRGASQPKSHKSKLKNVPQGELRLVGAYCISHILVDDTKLGTTQSR